MTTPPLRPPHPGATSGAVDRGAPTGARPPGAGPDREPVPVPDDADRRRRAGPVAATLTATGVLLAAVLATWAALRPAGPDGAPDPVVAVQSFLEAVYRDLDPAAALALVCAEAQDEEAMTARIASIAEFVGAGPTPIFSWDRPRVVARSDTAATIEVTLRVLTSGGATELPLQVQALATGGRGWRVCELDPLFPGAATAAPDPDDAADRAR